MDRGYKIGDELTCVFSADDNFYVVGKKYVVANIDHDGYPRIRDEDGDCPTYGVCPKTCRVWRFEK